MGAEVFRPNAEPAFIGIELQAGELYSQL